ncbi:MAG: DEAD/DEAH box helicase [Patescibacteria group bacterium]|nr:DEAD/DEAH box helicase [Patescibacteria group bacterium]
MQSRTFDNLGLAPKILEILDRLNFKTPTPIQHQSIPPALAGKDIMGIAQTGTGKTLAFGIPLIQRLAQYKGQGLIILPTRELAVQVNDSLLQVGRSLGLKTAVLIGGENMNKQIGQIKKRPHIIIATPGRMNDHLEQGTVSLHEVTAVILDEADRMLDMGFAPQISQIIKKAPAKRQTMLFSATMPQEIMHLANSYMQLPVRVEVAPPGTAARTVTQELFFVRKENKPALLENILNEYKGSVLVFSRTKFGAKRIAANIRRLGYAAAEIHSNRSLNQRLEALRGFKLGKYRILVATDIAARGIDVVGIELVINYDLPQHPADYVHRIGRTGRAEHNGHAISFATPDQNFDVRAIERLIKKQLSVSQLPVLPGQKNQPEPAANFKNFHAPRRQAPTSYDRSGKTRSALGPGRHKSKNYHRPGFAHRRFR